MRLGLVRSAQSSGPDIQDSGEGNVRGRIKPQLAAGNPNRRTFIFLAPPANPSGTPFPAAPEKKSS